MAVDTVHRPPLPAPTEEAGSMEETDLATDVSRRTDNTSISIPEDGRPVTIPTSRLPPSTSTSSALKGTNTSLLIEYFEGTKKGEKSRAKPSVRVKVTPSSAKRSKTSGEAVQITNIGSDRRPSYTRRISLGEHPDGGRKVVIDGTELSRSTGSNISGREPLEVEVMNGSDLSNRDLRYLEHTSDISSMPPDSLLDPAPTASTTEVTTEERTKPEQGRTGKGLEHFAAGAAGAAAGAAATTLLTAPKDEDRTRSLSRDRIARKVMEKLAGNTIDPAGRRSKTVEYEPDTKPVKDRRRRSSRSHHHDDVISPDGSQLSSGITPSQTSYRSGNSKVSLNNPRLLEMIEKTVRGVIIPELQQLRNEQKTTRNLRDFDDRRRTVNTDRDSYSTGLDRTVSKSSSTPDIRGKPRVVLNRYDDDPGHVLSRGDSERRKERRSSRGSVDGPEKRRRRSSRSYSVDEERDLERKDKKSHRIRDAAAGAIAGGILTTAALKHHEARGQTRKGLAKTADERSPTDSMTESTGQSYDVSTDSRPHHRHGRPLSEETSDRYYVDQARPALHNEHRIPFTGGPTDSEITRTSILSASTEHPLAVDEEHIRTPVKNVARGSASDIPSATELPSSHTPVPDKTLDRDATDKSIHEVTGVSPLQGDHANAKHPNPALIGAAAGLGGALAGYGLGKGKARAHEHEETDERQSVISPVQSVSSFRHGLNDPLIPQALHSGSDVSGLDGHRVSRYTASPLSSVGPQPSDGRISPLAPDVDSFASRQKRSSLQSRSIDQRHSAAYTNDSIGSSNFETAHDGKDVHLLGVNPQYVHHPEALESNVASLIDPSTVSSFKSSSVHEQAVLPTIKTSALPGRLTKIDHPSPAAYEMEAVRNVAPGSTHTSRSVTPLQHAQRKTATVSPRQNDFGTAHNDRYSTASIPIQLGASGVPDPDHAAPEIGYGLDSRSATASVVSEPRAPISLKESRERFSEGSQSPNKDTREFSFDRHAEGEHRAQPLTAAALGLAAGAAVAHAAKSRSPSAKSMSHQVTAEEVQREAYAHQPRISPYDSPRKATITPNNAPLYTDEGYASGAQRSTDDTPLHHAREFDEYSEDDLANFDVPVVGTADPFGNVNRQTYLDNDPHPASVPLYDTTASQRLDDTPIEDLLTLLKNLIERHATEWRLNATEWRQNFDELKRFVAESDRAVMKNTDRNADTTVNKILTTPRTQLQNSPRPNQATSEEASVSTKRPNFFKRAFKGLNNSSSADLVRIENMLNQLLVKVEYLETAQVFQAPKPRPPSSMDLSSVAASHEDGFNSYEALRAHADSGYEPEGRPGTGSTPHQSGQPHFSPPQKQMFHSGYDGRRDSINRVSTVLEGDEEDEEINREDSLTPKPSFAQSNAADHFDSRRNGMMFGTPPPVMQSSADQTPDGTPEKSRKHQSTGSSGFVPKVSRWSKTTTGSSSEGYNSQRPSGEQQRLDSSGTPGGNAQREYQYDEYSDQSGSRRSSAQSLPRSLAPSQGTGNHSERSIDGRRSSPLSPAGPASQQRRSYPQAHAQAYPQTVRGTREVDDQYIEDFKFVPVRDSLLLQHPQPVAGDGKQRGSHLESQAHGFQHSTPSIAGTESTLSDRSVESEFDPNTWGSNPAVSLARAQRLGKINAAMPSAHSPAHSASPDTAPSPHVPRGGRDRVNDNGGDDGPTLPIQKPSSPDQEDEWSEEYDEDDDDEEEEYDHVDEHLHSSSSGKRYERSSAPPRSFERHYYSSPLGSGHLLEPIQEVRYSLETDSGRRTPGGSSSTQQNRFSAHSRDLSTGSAGGGGPGPNQRKSGLASGVDRAGSTPSPGPEASPGTGGLLKREEPVRKITGPRPMSGSFARKGVVGARS